MADCRLQWQHVHVKITVGLQAKKKKKDGLEKQIVIFKLMVNEV